MAKQAIQKKSDFNSSLKYRLLVVLIPGALVLAVLLFLIFGYDSLASRKLNANYSDLSIPSQWISKNHEFRPANIFENCIIYPDVSCPSHSYTLKPTESTHLAVEFHTIYKSLQNKGYDIEDKCLNQACGNYFIKASKGSVAVRASAQKSNETQLVYVTIEKN